MLTGLPAEATAWMKSVWRHRKAGVCNTSTTLGDLGHLLLGVDVGEDRHAQRLANVGQDLQALLHAGTAKRLARAAVGLVVGGLEDEGHGEIVADALELAGCVHLQLARFDHARTGDQKQRLIEAGFEVAEFASVQAALARSSAGSPASATAPPALAIAARMKAENSGWPLRGVEVNSGWNWQPTNQG